MAQAGEDDDSVAKLGKTLKGEIDAVLAAVGKLEQKQKDLTASDKAQADCHANGKLYDASEAKCVLAVSVSCGDTVPAGKGRPEVSCGGKHFAEDTCVAKCPPGYTGANATLECGLDGQWRYTGKAVGGCADVDECKEGTHTCKGGVGECRNVVGSFMCRSTGDVEWAFDFDKNHNAQGWTAKGLWAPGSATLSDIAMPGSAALGSKSSAFGKEKDINKCQGVCAANKESYLGGQCAGAGTEITSPTLVLKNAHRAPLVSFTFVVQKSWDDEAGVLKLNGQEVWRKRFEYHNGYKVHYSTDSASTSIGQCKRWGSSGSSSTLARLDCNKDKNCAGYTTHIKDNNLEVPDCLLQKEGFTMYKSGPGVRMYEKVSPDAAWVQCVNTNPWTPWTRFGTFQIRLDCGSSDKGRFKGCKDGQWEAGSKLQFTFSTTLNNGPYDESWGIQKFALLAK